MGVKIKAKKGFRFSCSYDAGPKTMGRNYTLWIVINSLSESRDASFFGSVQDTIINNFHNRHLSSDVESFGGCPVSDSLVLEAAHKILSDLSPQYPILSIELEVDDTTGLIYASN